MYLKGEYAGIKKWKLSNIRIYLVICKECRRNKHDSVYGRCNDCERTDDIINLYDVTIREDDTYDNLHFDDKECKKWTEYNP